MVGPVWTLLRKRFQFFVSSKQKQKMYGSQVCSDFDLSGVAAAFPAMLSWGKQAFQTQLLTKPTTDHAEIRRRQLPLLGLRQNKPLCEKWKSALQTLSPTTEKVDACSSNDTDDLLEESVSQVFWKRDSFGAFLNPHSSVINSLLFWKTMVVPFFAVILPLLTVIVPFFILQWMGRNVSIGAYMSQIRSILVKQMSIPSALRAKGEGDKLGYVLESIFVALTLGAFGSGIWTQITSAIHLRAIWRNLEERGAAVLQTLSVARTLCGEMESVGSFRWLAAEGRAALSAAAAVVGADPVSTFGTLLNTGATSLRGVCEWLGKVDVYVTLASGVYGPICVPRIEKTETPHLTLDAVRHPLVKGCVTNNFASKDKPHILLTGPNRGGKSTYCKAVGLSVLFAQTWGFACASRMIWSPFAAFHSALETNGRLGFNSTFEAEIEFAKGVLSSARHSSGPIMVMMDEIFHSTNAVDGVAASKVFLGQLYETKGVVSLLSTHYRELAAAFEKAVVTQHLETSEDKDGLLTYYYRVIPGVSDKSSVMEILREKGLLPGTGAVHVAELNRPPLAEVPHNVL